MANDNEVKKLANVAAGAYASPRPSWTDVAVAVRNAVLAGLAEKGGTLSVDMSREDVLLAAHWLKHERLEVFNDKVAKRLGEWLEANAEAIFSQGATIAALQQRVSELEEDLHAQTTISVMTSEDNDRLRYERDAYRQDWQAELDGARNLRQKYGARENETFFQFVDRIIPEARASVARAEQAERDSLEISESAEESELARIAAESALATLRKAVDAAGHMLGCGQHDVAQTVLANALAATPAPERPDNDSIPSNGSEHPDTATLRAIRERGQSDDRMLKAMDDAPVSSDLLRDSDGDEGWAKVRAQARSLRDYLLGDSGLSGGGETCVGCGAHGSGLCASCEAEAKASQDELAHKPTSPGLAACVPVEADTSGCCYEVPGGCERHRMAKAQRSHEPTEAEDLGRVVAFVKAHGDGVDVLDVLSTLARLRRARQRAAEEMRERCAGRIKELLSVDGVLDFVRRRPEAHDAMRSSSAGAVIALASALGDELRALPLKP